MKSRLLFSVTLNTCLNLYQKQFFHFDICLIAELAKKHNSLRCFLNIQLETCSGNYL